MSAAAAGCIVVSGGTCAPLVGVAAATTFGASLYRNLRGESDYCGLAVDLAFAGATFGTGTLWSSVTQRKFYVVSPGDRKTFARVGAVLFFDIDLIGQYGTGGDLWQWQMRSSESRGT